MGSSDSLMRDKKIGLQIIECVEDSDGLSVIPVEQIEDAPHESHPKMTIVGWVYIDVENRAGLEQLYEILPFSIQQMVQVVPYRENTILLRYTRSQFEVEQSNFHTPLSGPTKSYITQVVAYMNDLYQMSPLSKHFDLATPVTQIGPTQLQFTENTLIEQNRFNSPLSLTNILTANNLAIDKLVLLDETAEYDYECTLKQRTHHSKGTVSVGDLDVTSFVEKLLQAYAFLCPSCESKSVIHPKIGINQKFICTNCNTQFALDIQNIQQQIQSRTPTEFVRVISNSLTEIAKTTHQEVIETQKQRLSDQNIEYELLPLSDSRAIFYKFTEDTVTCTLISGIVQLTFDTINPEFTRHNGSPVEHMVYPCRVCSKQMNETYTTSINARLFNPDTDTFTGINPHSICVSCMESLLEGVTDSFYTGIPTEKTLSELI